MFTHQYRPGVTRAAGTRTFTRAGGLEASWERAPQLDSEAVAAATEVGGGCTGAGAAVDAGAGAGAGGGAAAVAGLANVLGECVAGYDGGAVATAAEADLGGGRLGGTGCCS